MLLLLNRLFAGAILALGLIAPALAIADDPPAQKPALPVPLLPPHQLPDDIPTTPLPLTDIPDDPPPHEGAMITIPYILEPPDIIDVEVIEALPGRPISGE